MEKEGVVIFDLDDTLVEKEGIFVNAQKAMLQSLANCDPAINPDKHFSILREIDHELVCLHKGNHSYESWRLAEALWLHLHEGENALESASLSFQMSKTNINNVHILEAGEQYDKILKENVPKLRDDAGKVLAKLKKKYVLVLFSSEEKEPQQKIISSLGLDKVFDIILIHRIKNATSMSEAKRKGEEVLRMIGGKPKRMVMVGDRMSQDIIPAKMIGLETIWIPGPYYPGKREEGPPDHEISDLRDLLNIL
jgi:FMN phosphatase YigB (HAD superfamily)